MSMWQICGLLLTIWAGSVLAAPFIGSLPTCDNETEALTSDGVVQCPYYYNLLESALLANGSGNLYRILQALFPSNGVSPGGILFNMTIIVDEIPNGTCHVFDEELTFSSCSEGGTDCSSSMSVYYQNIKPTSKSLFHCTMVEIVQELGKFIALYPLVHVSVGNPVETCEQQDKTICMDILLHLDQLPCNPGMDSTVQVVLNLLSWIKGYAQMQNRPQEWKDAYRGKATSASSKCDEFMDELNSHQLTALVRTMGAVWAGFVSINVFAFLLLIRFIPSYYKKFVLQFRDSQDDRKLSVYWGAVIVVNVIMVMSMVLSVNIYISQLSPYVADPIEILLLAFVFLLWCCIVWKFCFWVIMGTLRSRDDDIWWISSKSFFLCCCCCCCLPAHTKSFVGQVLGLVSFFFLVQIVAFYACPISLLIILNPSELLPILALFVSAFLCIIMVVAHLNHAGVLYQSNPDRKHLRLVVPCLVQLFLIIAFVSFVFSVVLFYLFLLEAGLKVRGPGSFLASLIPSAALSAGAWYIKTKFLRTNAGAQSTDRSLARCGTPGDEEAGGGYSPVPGDNHPGVETASINEEPGERTRLRN